MIRWALIFLLLCGSAFGTVNANHGSCVATCCATGSVTVVLGDTLVPCGGATLTSLTPTFSDSVSNSYTPVPSALISGTALSADCALATANASGSTTGTVARSGSPGKNWTVFADLGVTYNQIDYSNDAAVGSASCFNINDVPDCPPGCGDLIFSSTPKSASEMIVAVALLNAGSGTWCSTPANCSTGTPAEGSSYQLTLSGSGGCFSTSDGSACIGTLTTTTATAMSPFGASLQDSVAASGTPSQPFVFVP